MRASILQESSRSPIEQEMKWTAIAELKVESRAVNVRFRVLEKEKTRQVIARGTGRVHQVSNCVVGDTTAVVTLTLWNNDICEVEVGNTVVILVGGLGEVSVQPDSVLAGEGKAVQ